MEDIEKIKGYPQRSWDGTGTKPKNWTTLTVMQRKFLKEYLEHGNQKLAVINAGYKVTEETASATASHVKRRLEGNIQQLMKDAGIDDLNIVKLLKEGLELGVEHRNTPKYLDTTLKMKGYLGKNGEDGDGGNLVVNVVNYNNYNAPDNNTVDVSPGTYTPPDREPPVRILMDKHS